ncbi:expressed unknown protein [Seminavis robusta]|uniref:Uncharacterized protein n=1 Tax=Seminavis robusta TaxID=568900 RepID=A0A9N8HLY2_9STRA|nr:expressed unknown protein [Seminavis robusta]|eukprot:Sro1068_g237490.1 n/a (211) ;mRNA; r:19214-19846
MPGKIKKWLTKHWKVSSSSNKFAPMVDGKSGSDRTISERPEAGHPTCINREEHERQLAKDVRAVERWIEMWRQKRLDEVVALSCTECMYHVTLDEGAEKLEMRLLDFIEQMRLCYESFPDYESVWDSVEPDPTNGAIIIKNYCSTATHTGKPFAFGPYPPILANGAKIRDDAISLHVFLKDGKPMYVKTALEGVQIGPAAYYTQIGGLII